MDKIKAQEIMTLADELATAAMKAKNYKGLDDKTIAKYYVAYRSDYVNILLAQQAVSVSAPVSAPVVTKTSTVVKNAK